MTATKPVKPVRPRRAAVKTADTLGMRLAAAAGLTGEAKTKHLNAKVRPALFEAALAALATQDDLGPWLAAQWGVLADVDPELFA
ncbi:hypothetical protein [Sphingomonas sp. dw_22]|uniref:hypothetical protein n=1 Tax=Sphingomonas sp. dw_22 TaxID=2721175 RepID=UPI001BD3B0BF|nr:hypothetical protein [Sphingomonas sp. dw_22]